MFQPKFQLPKNMGTTSENYKDNAFKGLAEVYSA